MNQKLKELFRAFLFKQGGHQFVNDYSATEAEELAIKFAQQYADEQPSYHAPNAEYFVMNQMRIRYAREWTNLHTGEIKEGAPSFDEYLKLNR